MNKLDVSHNDVCNSQVTSVCSTKHHLKPNADFSTLLSSTAVGRPWLPWHEDVGFYRPSPWCKTAGGATCFETVWRDLVNITVRMRAEGSETGLAGTIPAAALAARANDGAIRAPFFRTAVNMVAEEAVEYAEVLELARAVGSPAWEGAAGTARLSEGLDLVCAIFTLAQALSQPGFCEPGDEEDLELLFKHTELLEAHACSVGGNLAMGVDALYLFIAVASELNAAQPAGSWAAAESAWTSVLVHHLHVAALRIGGDVYARASRSGTDGAAALFTSWLAKMPAIAARHRATWVALAEK